jgi:homoprotocatechuate degradation regulator HpaR
MQFQSGGHVISKPTSALPKHSAAAAHQDGMRDFSRSLPMALLRARESVMARFRPMLREHGITEQQWRVLRALHSAHAPMSASQLAEHTLLSLPSLSRLLKTLEERRAIRRQTHHADLRSTQISISAAGTRIVASIAPSSELHYADITRLLGASDVERLYDLLESCVARLGHGSDTDSDSQSSG